MALKKCNECENIVSSSAKACPKCGAKTPRKKWWLWIPLGLTSFFLILGMIAPEDKSREEAIEFASLVKRMMKDPQSFDVIELRISSLGTICLTYRAKNSFNAYLQGYAVKKTDGETYIEGVSGTDNGIWAGYCSIGDGRTVTVSSSYL